MGSQPLSGKVVLSTLAAFITLSHDQLVHEAKLPDFIRVSQRMLGFNPEEGRSSFSIVRIQPLLPGQ